MEQTTEEDYAQQQEWNKLFQELLFIIPDNTDAERKSVPCVLSEDPLSVPVLMQHIQQLLSTCRREDVLPPSSLDHLTIMSESLGNYLAKQLDQESYEILTHKVNAATTHWLHKFLRFPRTTKGYYRATKQRARLLLMKMVLIQHYPTYPTDGFYAFNETTPVILASRCWLWLDELRLDLGLPLKSVVIFKDTTHLLSLLETLSSPDSTLRPFILVGSSGGWKEDFDCDDIPKLIEISEKYKLWCHVEGCGILALAAPAAYLPEFSQAPWHAIMQADSILFNALTLLGFPEENKMIPTVFYRNDRHSLVALKSQETLSQETAPAISASQGVELSSVANPSSPPVVRPVDHGMLTLQLWFAFQYVGRERLRLRVDKALQLCRRLYTQLHSLPYGISIMTPPNNLLLVFQYVPLYRPEDCQEETQSSLSPLFIEKVNQQVLTDVVNSTSAVHLELDLVSTSESGRLDHIRFNPFYSSNLEVLDPSLVDTFASNLSLEIELIDATLKQKAYFQKLVWSHARQGLYNVDVPNFIGLGAVWYIPPLLLPGKIPAASETPQPPPHPTGLGTKLQEEIDHLNKFLAAKLIASNQKSIFQQAIDVEGRCCIVLGVDTTPVTEERCSTYVDEIIRTASSVEKEFDFSKQIGKIIESGIKEAEDRLRKQNERLEAEGGLIRKIPIVGSVWNWWSPTNQTLRGNSFSLLTTQVSDPPVPVTKKPTSIRKPSFEVAPTISSASMPAGVTSPLPANLAASAPPVITFTPPITLAEEASTPPEPVVTVVSQTPLGNSGGDTAGPDTGTNITTQTEGLGQSG